MRGKKAHNYFDDPLPGSKGEVRDGQWTTLSESLLMRLRLCAGTEMANALYDKIVDQAKQASIPHQEFILNEVQYEVRKHKAEGLKETDDLYEKMLLALWSRDVANMGYSTAARFMNSIQSFRTKRSLITNEKA